MYAKRVSRKEKVATWHKRINNRINVLKKLTRGETSRCEEFEYRTDDIFLGNEGLFLNEPRLKLYLPELTRLLRDVNQAIKIRRVESITFLQKYAFAKKVVSKREVKRDYEQSRVPGLVTETNQLLRPVAGAIERLQEDVVQMEARKAHIMRFHRRRIASRRVDVIDAQVRIKDYKVRLLELLEQSKKVKVSDSEKDMGLGEAKKRLEEAKAIAQKVKTFRSYIRKKQLFLENEKTKVDDLFRSAQMKKAVDEVSERIKRQSFIGKSPSMFLCSIYGQ